MDLSILISLSNRLDFTRACLESLERTAGRFPCEVILVDDGSTDGTREFLRTLAKPRYRFLLNARPRGFACNINAAAQLARAPILCLLHNDTVLMPGWLPPMLRVLRRTVDAGCVGNVQREPFSGLIDHIGIGFDSAGLPFHAGKNGFTPPIAQSARWPAVSAACLLVRKFVFTSLGGFDEALSGGFEDVDFCLRAAEAGYRHHVANRSSIYHYIGMSSGYRREEDVSLARYRVRWEARFLAYAARREGQRADWEHAHVFTPENQSAWREQWELGRETRRQHRQDIADARADGRRYLRKHLARPWRYNFGRVCRALVQAAHPRPAALPPPPRIDGNGRAQNGAYPAAAAADKDRALFDPPQP
jgi:GT2 family glycosyltransferase